jgi:uncharacterized protein (TIGR03435 family)
MRAGIAAAMLWGVLAARLSSQATTPTAQPTFDVASVKPHLSGESQSMVAQPGGRFVATNVPLRLLIRTAYQLQDDQISGEPEWVNAERFDIVAKSDAPEALPRLVSMLQSLLAERFKLVVHREMKELPVFALSVAKRDSTLGPKLRPTTCPDIEVDLGRPQPCTNVSTGRGELRLRGMPFGQFLPFLAPYVNRVIVDRTGLSARYDIDLNWTPDRLPQAAPPDAATADPNAVSIFTAIQEQLGLKLEPARAPVEVLVIDRVQRPTPD